MDETGTKGMYQTQRRVKPSQLYGADCALNELSRSLCLHYLGL